jgi:four helix bundle protein
MSVREDPVREKSFEFALRIIKLCRYLQSEYKEYIMTKQLLKSGTSIGANLSEALYAQSKADFISKNSIALKEAAETRYWLSLLYASGYLNDTQFLSIKSDVDELIKLLTTIVKNSKNNEGNEK